MRAVSLLIFYRALSDRPESPPEEEIFKLEENRTLALIFQTWMLLVLVRVRFDGGSLLI